MILFMKNGFRFISVMAVSVMLTGCAQDPQTNVLPTHQEVVDRRDDWTMSQAHEYCRKRGGSIEQWEGSESFCIMPQGYGCEPMAFVKGDCGSSTDF